MKVAEEGEGMCRKVDVERWGEVCVGRKPQVGQRQYTKLTFREKSTVYTANYNMTVHSLLCTVDRVQYTLYTVQYTV